MLKQLKSEGGTSLYDAIFLASRELEFRDGRHVMVLVTDGGDTTSSEELSPGAGGRATGRHHLVSGAGGAHHQRCRPQRRRRECAHHAGGGHRRPRLHSQPGRAAGSRVRRHPARVADTIPDRVLSQGRPAQQGSLSHLEGHRAKRFGAIAGLRVSTRSGYYGEANEGRSGFGQ